MTKRYVGIKGNDTQGDFIRRSPRSACKIIGIWHVRYRRLNSPAFAWCAILYAHRCESPDESTNEVERLVTYMKFQIGGQKRCLEPGNKIGVANRRDRRRKSPSAKFRLFIISYPARPRRIIVKYTVENNCPKKKKSRARRNFWMYRDVRSINYITVCHACHENGANQNAGSTTFPSYRAFLESPETFRAYFEC